jgi:ubiquitin carboxyl-terminal hydrolase 10
VQVDKSSSGEVSQQVLLEALPPVLVLHLERFLYDVAADGMIKISKSIKKPILFAPELEIPLGTIFLFSPCYPRLIISRGSVGLEIMVPVAGKSVEPECYKLYGVLYHRGESASSGQYTVDVLHPNGDNNSGGEGWLHIDDEAVSMVRHEDVFGPGGDNNEQVDGRCAYMLFYCRISPTQT